MRFIDLQEGPNDPGIFKAIFLAGGPGSGKGYVAQQLGLQARGLKVINSDDAFEYLMRKRKLSFEMPPQEQPDRDAARQRAKDMTSTKQDLYLDGRLGIIIDGTAKDPNKMAKLKAELESIGYQTMMVFVNTSLRTALQRNLLRDRKVPSDIVMQSHEQVQANKNSLADVFTPNYDEVKQEVIDFINNDGVTLVLCDGGDKIGEFNLLSNYIKPGDFIMAHDYSQDSETFESNVNNKIWNWHEISDKDIEDACVKNNLISYKKDVFDNVVWVCKTKI